MLSELHLHTVPPQDEDTAVPPVAAVLQALAVLGELHSKLRDFGKTDPRNSPSSSGGCFRLVLTLHSSRTLENFLLSWLVFPTEVNAGALTNRKIFILLSTWNYSSFPDNSVYF